MIVKERLANPFVIIHTGIAIGMILFTAIICDTIQRHRPEQVVFQNELRPVRVSLENKNPKEGGCLR